MLRDVVGSVISESSVDLTFHVEALDLSLDQLSIIAMLVIEVTNNAMKHVFQQQLGSRLQVTLVALPGKRANLAINDDGPGTRGVQRPRQPPAQNLGMRIIQGLAEQIEGTVSTNADQGTEVVITFLHMHVLPRSNGIFAHAGDSRFVRIQPPECPRSSPYRRDQFRWLPIG